MTILSMNVISLVNRLYLNFKRYNNRLKFKKDKNEKFTDRCYGKWA